MRRKEEHSLITNSIHILFLVPILPDREHWNYLSVSIFRLSPSHRSARISLPIYPARFIRAANIWHQTVSLTHIVSVEIEAVVTSIKLGRIFLIFRAIVTRRELKFHFCPHRSNFTSFFAAPFQTVLCSTSVSNDAILFESVFDAAYRKRPFRPFFDILKYVVHATRNAVIWWRWRSTIWQIYVSNDIMRSKCVSTISRIKLISRVASSLQNHSGVISLVVKIYCMRFFVK